MQTVVQRKRALITLARKIRSENLEEEAGQQA